MKRAHKLRSVPDSVSVDSELPRGHFIEGRLVAVDEEGHALFHDGGEAQVPLRLPRHVDRRWLEAAVRLAPVPAIALHPEELKAPLLWCVFSAPEHAALDERFQVHAKTIDLEARESIRIRTGRSIVTVNAAGDIQVRGRNLTTRASNVNRIRGGAVRIN
jgi:hypothetical protein